MPGYEWIGDKEREQVNQVFDTGILFRYEFKNERNGVYKVREFEEKFAAFNGTPYAQAVTSGTAALKVAMAALGIQPGDEIITQGFTFIATFEAIIEAGAIPVPCEIDDTLNLDPEDFRKKITQKTAAVIPVHMLGSPARINEIIQIASQKGIKVLEDTAQALGASVNGKKVGSIGHAGTFSFDFYKTITTGEGGMVITNDQNTYVRASEYADHGHDHNPAVGRALEGRSFLGFNYRMNEMQGAVGLAQLERLPEILKVQKNNQEKIRSLLGSIKNIELRALPEGAQDSHTHLCFFLPDSNKTLEFHKRLTSNGVSAIHFQNNLWHFLPNWEHLIGQKTAWPGCFPFGKPYCQSEISYSPDMLPRSADYLSRTIVLPISLKLDRASIDRICNEIENISRDIL
mgnify:FL=1